MFFFLSLIITVNYSEHFIVTTFLYFFLFDKDSKQSIKQCLFALKTTGACMAQTD